jgi:hypothetical protein
MFLEVGWDVRRNRAPPQVTKPPSGAMLTELLAKTVRLMTVDGWVGGVAAEE